MNAKMNGTPIEGVPVAVEFRMSLGEWERLCSQLFRATKKVEGDVLFFLYDTIAKLMPGVRDDLKHQLGQNKVAPGKALIVALKSEDGKIEKAKKV